MGETRRSALGLVLLSTDIRARRTKSVGRSTRGTSGAPVRCSCCPSQRSCDPIRIQCSGFEVAKPWSALVVAFLPLKHHVTSHLKHSFLPPFVRLVEKLPKVFMHLSVVLRTRHVEPVIPIVRGTQRPTTVPGHAHLFCAVRIAWVCVRKQRSICWLVRVWLLLVNITLHILWRRWGWLIL